MKDLLNLLKNYIYYIILTYLIFSLADIFKVLNEIPNEENKVEFTLEDLDNNIDMSYFDSIVLIFFMIIISQLLIKLFTICFSFMSDLLKKRFERVERFLYFLSVYRTYDTYNEFYIKNCKWLLSDEEGKDWLKLFQYYKTFQFICFISCFLIPLSFLFPNFYVQFYVLSLFFIYQTRDILIRLKVYILNLNYYRYIRISLQINWERLKTNAITKWLKLYDYYYIIRTCFHTIQKQLFKYIIKPFLDIINNHIHIFKPLIKIMHWFVETLIKWIEIEDKIIGKKFSFSFVLILLVNTTKGIIFFIWMCLYIQVFLLNIYIAIFIGLFFLLLWLILEQQIKKKVEAKFKLSSSKYNNLFEISHDYSQMKWFLDDYKKWLNSDEGKEWIIFYRDIYIYEIYLLRTLRGFSSLMQFCIGLAIYFPNLDLIFLIVLQLLIQTISFEIFKIINKFDLKYYWNILNMDEWNNWLNRYDGKKWIKIYAFMGYILKFMISIREYKVFFSLYLFIQILLIYYQNYELFLFIGLLSYLMIINLTPNEIISGNNDTKKTDLNNENVTNEKSQLKKLEEVSIIKTQIEPTKKRIKYGISRKPYRQANSCNYRYYIIPKKYDLELAIKHKDKQHIRYIEMVRPDLFSPWNIMPWGKWLETDEGYQFIQMQGVWIHSIKGHRWIKSKWAKKWLQKYEGNNYIIKNKAWIKKIKELTKHKNIYY